MGGTRLAVVAKVPRRNAIPVGEATMQTIRHTLAAALAVLALGAAQAVTEP